MGDAPQEIPLDAVRLAACEAKAKLDDALRLLDLVWL